MYPVRWSQFDQTLYKQIDLKISLDEYLEKIRYENAEILPDLPVIISDTIKTTLHDFIGEIMIIMFFSPGCGSCKQELRGINQLIKSDDKGIRYIFILNKPQKLRQAYQLFRYYNYKNGY